MTWTKAVITQHPQPAPNIMTNLTALHYRFLLLVLLLTPPSPAAIVQTLDGKTHEGEIRFDTTDQLTLSTRTNGSVHIDLPNLLSAQFRASSTAAEPPPIRWQSREIGQGDILGSVRVAGTTLTIRGAGALSTTNRDRLYFCYQTLNGDGQIIARIAGVQQTNRNALAGVMIRAGLDESSPYAMSLLFAGEGACFQYRSRLNTPARQEKAGDSPPPLWVRLTRSGNNFTAYSSVDGQEWDKLGAHTIAMPPQAIIGVAVCSNNPAAVCTALFERVSITTGAVKPDPHAPQPFKGVLLRDGCMVAGQIQSANTSAIRLWRPREQAISIPAGDVCRIVFNPISPRFASKLRSNRPGALLTGGDFVEGEFEGQRDNQISIRSILFGVRRIETWKTAAIVLRDAPAAAAAYEVRTADGSILHADRLAIQKDTLTVETRLAGKLSFAPADIVEIRAGASRFRSLADLRPAKAEPPKGGSTAFTIDATGAGIPMILAGKSCQRGIGLPAGSRLTYTLDANYRILIMQLGVPDGILPTTPVRFVISADGREIHRTPLRTSLDAPIPLTLAISNIKSLEIRLESDPPNGPGAIGLLGDPALVR